MTRVPAVALVAGVGVLAAWLAGSVGARSPQTLSYPELPEAPALLDPVVAQVRSQAGRLERSRAATPPPARVTRNPFRFADNAPPPPDVAPPRGAEARGEPPPAVPAPVLALIGMAEDQGPDGPLRTAILSGLEELFLVREGQEFGARFTAVRIDPTSVSVLDRATGRTIILSLK